MHKVLAAAGAGCHPKIILFSFWTKFSLTSAEAGDEELTLLIAAEVRLGFFSLLQP